MIRVFSNPHPSTLILLQCSTPVISYRQFYLLNERFRCSINQRGRFNGSLRTFRRRHHNLCLLVKLADSFFMFSNVASFLCHVVIVMDNDTTPYGMSRRVFIVIIILYSLIFYVDPDPLINIGSAFLLIGNAISMVWTTVDGILINHEVCYLYVTLSNKWSLICSTFLSAINLLHFTPLFVFISSRNRIIF